MDVPCLAAVLNPMKCGVDTLAVSNAKSRRRLFIPLLECGKFPATQSFEAAPDLEIHRPCFYFSADAVLTGDGFTLKYEPMPEPSGLQMEILREVD